jgi:hypothetical protein
MGKKDDHDRLRRELEKMERELAKRKPSCNVTYDDLLRIAFQCRKEGRDLNDQERALWQQFCRCYDPQRFDLEKLVQEMRSPLWGVPNKIEIRLCRKVRALYPAEMSPEQAAEFRKFCEQQKVTEEMLALRVEHFEERYRDPTTRPQYGLKLLPRPSENGEPLYED